MLIEINVRPQAKKNEIKELNPGKWRVSLTTVPEKGKANHQLIKLLAKKFNVKKSQVLIIKGQLSSQKLVEIQKTS